MKREKKNRNTHSKSYKQTEQQRRIIAMIQNVIFQKDTITVRLPSSIGKTEYLLNMIPAILLMEVMENAIRRAPEVETKDKKPVYQCRWTRLEAP